MTLTGRSILGFQTGKPGGIPFHAVDPTTGKSCEPAFVSVSMEEIDLAAHLAADAFPEFSSAPREKRAQLLRSIASNLEASAQSLIERGNLETALPKGRLQNELGRTCNQLRLFAGVAEEGSWASARIDRGDPHRAPTPKPDIRSMLRPVGPVVVFGASNFPLAFSVAGGDTASALAAGNPVIVKAHPAHPGVSEIAGHAVLESVRSCGLPEVCSPWCSIAARQRERPWCSTRW